ncbi:hypothetical protein [Herminiimonas sp. CN]|uniref:hypothetical protein n=1 Tax=Herminiimonas sp. CN TaxID=1349818 RepID=UPI0012DED75F|nr:hypothetical protein [Herminiimonas sp. CN]
MDTFDRLDWPDLLALNAAIKAVCVSEQAGFAEKVTREVEAIAQGMGQQCDRVQDGETG